MRPGSWSRFARSFLPAALSIAVAAPAQATAPSFGVVAPKDGPFPADAFTRIDAAQRSGLRVDLPYPDAPACAATPRPTECDDIDVLNALDGFNVQPRLSIPFTDAIDASSVTSETVFLLPLGSVLARGERRAAGEPIGINQVVWDPPSRTLHVESDALLEQDARYLLVVTRGVHDASGRPIERSDAFARFRRDLAFGRLPRDLPPERRERLKDYRASLVRALDRAEDAGIPEESIAVASVFTTQTVTAALEQVHAYIRGAPAPAPADFCLLADVGAPCDRSARTVFALSAAEATRLGIPELLRLKWTQVDTPPVLAQNIPPHATRLVDLGARVAQAKAEACGGAPCVGRIAFGRYASPWYLHQTRTLPPLATTAAARQPVGSPDVVYFNLFLPAGPPPSSSGWPVVLFGHGQGNSKHDFPFAVAGRLASHGFATLAINLAFHGFGPEGTLTATSTSGDEVVFPAGGRGVETNGDGIGSVEGTVAAAPRALLSLADGRLQTSADLMQLVRVIEAGVDVDGDGAADLDASRIFSLGFSAGSYVAMGLAVVEPAVRATAFATVLASMELLRLDVVTRPQVGSVLLQARTPPLANAPGLAALGDAPDADHPSPVLVPLAAPRFDENIPLRDRAPVENTVAGAMPLQELFERMEWAAQTSAPEAIAPYLRKTPLAGVPPRPVLLLFARGDQTDVNPSTARTVRAGDLLDRTAGFRWDALRAASPGISIPTNYPHRFLVSNDAGTAPPLVEASLAAQDLAAALFEHPDAPLGAPSSPVGAFFAVPFPGAIPEDFGFVR